MSTDTREVMLSKFKVKSVGGGSFLTYFHHDRAQSSTLAQTQPSLIEVYEAEIRREGKRTTIWESGTTPWQLSWMKS